MQGIVKTSYCDYKFTEEDYQKVKSLVENINRVLESLTDTQRALLSHCNDNEYNGNVLILDGVEYGSDADDIVQSRVHDELSVLLVI